VYYNTQETFIAIGLYSSHMLRVCKL